MARGRSAGANVAVMVASTWGAISAAVSPWSSRAAMSCPGLTAMPHSSEARPNPAIPIVNSRRWPYRSPSRPPVTMPLARANAYPPTMSSRAVAPAPRSLRNDGAATFTTKKSNWVTKVPASRTVSMAAGGPAR